MSAPASSVPVPGEGLDTTEARSFEEFFRAEHTRLFRALCLVVVDRNEAEDVAQVAFPRRLVRGAKSSLFLIAWNPLPP